MIPGHPEVWEPPGKSSFFIETPEKFPLFPMTHCSLLFSGKTPELDSPDFDHFTNTWSGLQGQYLSRKSELTVELSGNSEGGVEWGWRGRARTWSWGARWSSSSTCMAHGPWSMVQQTTVQPYRKCCPHVKSSRDRASSDWVTINVCLIISLLQDRAW